MRVFADTTTVVAFIGKGRSASGNQSHLGHNGREKHNINCEILSRVKNTEADWASCMPKDVRELSMNDEMLAEIFHNWGTLHLDIFMSRVTTG